jgi:hypothetical protein
VLIGDKERINMDIIWEDPPNNRRGRQGSWFDEFVEALKASKDKWTRVRDYDKPATASGTVQNLKKRFPGFEFRSATVDGRGCVYARFVGVDKAAS